MLKDHSSMELQIGYFHKIIGIDDTKGFFGFSKLIQLQTDDRNPFEVAKRCDGGKFGPYGFHTWNELSGECSCGLNEMPDIHFGHHVITMENLKSVSPIITFYPHIMILYFELNNELDEELSCKNPHSDCCRTLQELFRLIIEWHYAYEIYGSREEVAIACHNVITDELIPENIQNWILQTVPPQKVERFLMGDQQARNRQDIELIPDLSIEFDNWLEDKMLTRVELGTFEEKFNFPT
jgi:hypothetical protein